MATAEQVIESGGNLASEVICALDNGTSLPDVPPPDEDEDEE